MKGGIPACVYDKDLGKFRIIYSKGKATTSYGVSYYSSNSSSSTRGSSNIKRIIHAQIIESKQVDVETAKVLADDNDNQEFQPTNPTTSSSTNTSPAQPAAVYLFIEEALFLHEQGLLHAYLKYNEISNGEETNTDYLLDTRGIYNIMLHELQLPLQVYLTYSHLRAQTFIVVRHTVDRLNIIRSMNGKESNERGDNEPSDNTKQTKKRNHIDSFKMDFRKDSFHAPIPFVFGSNSGEKNTHASSDMMNQCIAFDVYKPNTQYRKTNPGQPDFHVAISSFSQPSPPFDTLKELIECSDGIPLRIAAVADGGTVIMFGITDFGVPSL
jgi:hypothetical protein